MANENVIKNMANEITRNCQSQNVSVDPEFVVYLIDLLLLNPKYGKLFSKTINRNNLQYFVEECVRILAKADTPLSTLKIQFIIQSNYDKIKNLIDKHMESIATCLRPLVNEILDDEPDLSEEVEYKKLFRKISIYIILASGLGNPGIIQTLKEGMAALESVFSLEDLKVFVTLPRAQKNRQLRDLVEVVSGVRLFNRDCKKGGEAIPDLPFNLIDAGKACLTSLSNSLITVMQRVNSLTTAIEDAVTVHDETGNVEIHVCHPSITVADYKMVFDLLIFHRQYEVFIRNLLTDVTDAVRGGTDSVDRYKIVLDELHAAVKYKAAVPVATVFPLFSKLSLVWRSMQHVMYVIARVSRLMSALAGIQETVALPKELIDTMLAGRKVVSDQDRLNIRVNIAERLSLSSLKNYVTYDDSLLKMNDRYTSYLGFCAMCLTVGALVPGNMKVGAIKYGKHRYGFCSVRMASKFSRDPARYINEVLHYSRNNLHIINFLNIADRVFDVKETDSLITVHVPKTKVSDKDIQTETHPIEQYIDKNYSWDLWEWKRRACQWANIVNCRTHSTQTDYSHLRSDIHSQTHEMRDKTQQTNKDAGVMTINNNVFVWGLRGQAGDKQHAAGLGDTNVAEVQKARVVTVCTWPCVQASDFRNNDNLTELPEKDEKTWSCNESPEKDVD